MTKEEILTLSLFLKNGYSTRTIDKELGFDSNISKGWESWSILKKYFLTKEDRHKLFLFTDQEIKAILKNISGAKNRSEAAKILIDCTPNIVSKYKNSYLLAKSESELSKILSGETRNITNIFFKKSKTSASTCQYKKCNSTDLETVHLNERRPAIFINAAKKSKIGKINELQIFDIYQTMIKYLHYHSLPKSICYLCKKHHLELERLEKNGPKAKYLSFVKAIRIKK
jgi:hypothetical protein